MDEKTFLYYSRKKENVLSAIDPICAAYGISGQDYKIDCEMLSEKLCVDGVEICCTGNSVSGVVDELTAYIFVSRYCKDRTLGAFHKQTINHITRNWVKTS